jgi:DNA sulfur modification protein DndD
MKIKRIVFENFMRFYEATEIKLLENGLSQSDLTVILAPNDSGKTCVIRALEFLFYGSVEGKHGPETLSLIVNDEAVRVSKKTEITASVEAEFITQEGSFSVRRTVKIEKEYSNKRKIVHGRGEPMTELEYFDGKWKSDLHGVYENKLEKMLPKSLFNYFVFQGEGLAEALIEKQDPRIKEGLTQLLHEDDWEDAIRDLSNLRDSVNRHCREVSAKDTELESSIGKLESAEIAEKNAGKKLKDKKKLLEDKKNEVDQLTSEISKSVNKIDEDAAKKLEQTKQDLKRHNDNLAGARQGLFSSIGDTHGLPFLRRGFQPVREILADLQSKNLLPADVSEGFITRVLNREKCMCGCELPKGSNHRSNVEQFRAQSLSTELNSDLFKLYNLLEDGSQKGFTAQIKEGIESFITSQEFIESEQTEINKYEKQLVALNARVDQAARDRCNNLLAAQRKADREKDVLNSDVEQLQREFTAAQGFRERAQQELNKARLRSKNKGNEKIFEKRDVIDAVLQILEQGLDNLKDSLHGPLERSVGSIYDDVVKDGSEAKINSSTLLPYVEKGGIKVPFLGGGQKQVLCISYIIGLAHLRQNLNDQLRSIGVLLPKSTEQAFIMDSIFAPCEPEYQEAICKFLPEAGQVILLVAGQQWTETVQTNLQGKIARVYGFEYHSPNKNYDKTKHLFKVGQKTHRLLNVVDPPHTALTIIKQLTA